MPEAVEFMMPNIIRFYCPWRQILGNGPKVVAKCVAPEEPSLLLWIFGFHPLDETLSVTAAFDSRVSLIVIDLEMRDHFIG